MSTCLSNIKDANGCSFKGRASVCCSEFCGFESNYRRAFLSCIFFFFACVTRNATNAHKKEIKYDIPLRYMMCTMTLKLMGAAVVEWLSSSFVEQWFRGSNLDLATSILVIWVSPALKSPLTERMLK